jgi:hypothetical protein
MNKGSEECVIKSSNLVTMEVGPYVLSEPQVCIKGDNFYPKYC